MTDGPMSDARRISVVVPCYNRAAYLEVLLTSLTWSAVPPSDFEVIVVNDGGVDHVGTVAHSWVQRGLDIRLLQLRTQGLPRNNARARNAGLREARHPIVIQTDPDIVFTSDVLQRARDTLAPGCFYSVSGYYPLTQEATLELAFGNDGPCTSAAAYLACAEGRPNQVLSPDGVGGLHGAFACAAADLIHAGGYDESFEHWGWEDRELLVTLAHLGLARHIMPDTPVVHLWHPILRGETLRDALAAKGQLSRLAWEVQMQRAAAEYPRPVRPRRRPAPTGDETRTSPQVFESTAYDEWVDDEPTRPIRHQLFFDAHRLEADALLASGHAALAREVLAVTAHAPWERAAAASHAADQPALDVTAFLADRWRTYRRVDAAVELVARCCQHLKDVAARDAALRALEQFPEGPAAAAAIRTQSALEEGNLQEATRQAQRLRGSGWTAARAALAVEVALLSRRFDQAAAIVSACGASDDVKGDYFEELRWTEYQRLIQANSGINVPPDARPSPAAGERSEFLYSAALRSLRGGLDIGACRLLDRFLASAPPAEPRLFVEGRRHREQASERLRLREAAVLSAAR